MKRFLFILIIIFSITIPSCQRTNGTMFIIKDCTGDYLRYDGLDYPICNSEKVANIYSGTIVEATFIKTSSDYKCDDIYQWHCMMFHPYKMGDRIRVIRIK